MNDQAAVAGHQRATLRGFMKLRLSESRTQIEGGGRVAGGFQRGISKPGAFADAAGGREQAGDGERESAARVFIRRRRQQAADVEQNLRARVLWQTLP